MNKELLSTSVVKSQIKRYLEEKKNFEEIKFKLEDIHFIFVTDEELKEFINTLK